LLTTWRSIATSTSDCTPTRRRTIESRGTKIVRAMLPRKPMNSFIAKQNDDPQRHMMLRFSALLIRGCIVLRVTTTAPLCLSFLPCQEADRLEPKSREGDLDVWNGIKISRTGMSGDDVPERVAGGKRVV
ncbi:hypothetical protein CI238_07116, partial [Colletotrichum incanum]